MARAVGSGLGVPVARKLLWLLKGPGCAPEAMRRFFLSGKYLMSFLSLETMKDTGGERPTEVKMRLCQRKTGTREY